MSLCKRFAPAKKCPGLAILSDPDTLWCFIRLTGSALSHLLLLCLNHLLNHIAADRSVLLCSQVAVVSVAQWNSKLIRNFILKTL